MSRELIRCNPFKQLIRCTHIRLILKFSKFWFRHTRIFFNVFFGRVWFLFCQFWFRLHFGVLHLYIAFLRLMRYSVIAFNILKSIIWIISTVLYSIGKHYSSKKPTFVHYGMRFDVVKSGVGFFELTQPTWFMGDWFLKRTTRIVYKKGYVSWF